MSANLPNKSNSRIVRFVQWNKRSLTPLLDAEEPFSREDIDTVDNNQWRKAQDTGMLVRSEDYGPNTRYWRLSGTGREHLEDVREDAPSYPEGTNVCPHCEHVGFMNLRDGGYECRNPQCGREFVEFAEVGVDV